MNILTHPVVQELQDAKIPFQVDGNEIVLDGFSKSGTARLVKGDPNVDNNDIRTSLVMKTRYGRETRVFDLQDIVAEAWHWYRYSCERMQGFQTDPIDPPARWMDQFISRGYCAVETVTVTKVKIL